MGFYIEVPDMKGKADQIKKIYNAKEIDVIDAHAAVQSGVGAVVCVVQNPEFDAAAFCHDANEFRRMTHPDDTRVRRWLLVDDRKLIERVSGLEAANNSEEA